MEKIRGDDGGGNIVGLRTVALTMKIYREQY